MADTSIGFLILAKDRASSTFNRVGRSAEGASTKLGKVGKVGKMAGLGLAAGVGAAAVAAVKLARNAMADQKEARRLEIALRNTTGATKKQVAAVEDWISKQGVALGVTDDELRPALNRLVTATHDVGKAQKLASLGMNIAAGTGKSLETVTMALAKAQNGNVSALGRLGLKVKDASGKTKTLAQITKDLSKTYGGQAAAAANSAEGKFGRLKLILDETGESIGYKLIPVLTTVATWMLNKGIPAVGRFGTWFNTHLLPPLREVGNFIGTKVIPWFQRFDFQTAKSSGTVRQFGSNAVSIFSSVKSILSSLGTFAQAFWGKYGDLITRYGIGTLRNFVTVVRGGMNIITGIFRTVAAVLRGDWGGAWGGIKQITRGAIGVVRGVLAQGWNLFRTLFQAGGRALGSIMSKAWDGITSAVRDGTARTVRWFKGLPGRILGVLGDLSKILYNAGVQLIAGLMKGIGDKAKDIGGFVKKNTVDKVTGAIKHGFGINSPAKKVIPYGESVVEGLEVGMRNRGARLGTSAVDLFKQLVKGIKRGQLTVGKALERVRSELERDLSKMAALKEERAGFMSTFTNGSSTVFSTDLSNGGGIGAILAAQAQQRDRAAQLAGDVQTLISRGLSKALLTQLQASGEGGMDQIHALASASADQIRLLNSLDAQSTAALQRAGLAVGNALRGGNVDTAIAQAQREVALDRVLEKMLNRLGTAEIHIHLEGDTIVRTLKARRRRTGKRLEAEGV